MQGTGILRQAEFTRFGQRFGKIGLKVGRQLFVKVRGGCKIGQKKYVRQIIAGTPIERRKIEHTGNKNQSVQIQTVAATQVLSQSRRSEHAIALAAKILWRQPTSAPGGPEADKSSDGFNIGR